MIRIKGIKNIEYFTKGHRGLLYTGEYKGKKIVIKTKNPKSKAENRIENEGRWLKRLNKKNIGPKLIKAAKKYLFYEYVEGEFFIDYVKSLKKDLASKRLILRIIKKVFDQCYILDRLKVDKEEMHKPVKHILVKKEKRRLDVVMLDFERCHIVNSSKNTTQFVVFLMRLETLLGQYGIVINQEMLIALAKLYKRYPTKENFKKILSEITN